MLRKTRKKKDMKPGAFLLLLIMPLVISAALACQNREARDSGRAPASTPATQNKIAPAERWLGKWNGPEGTFLEISQISQGYQITIQNLDGPRTFPAEPEAEGLQFVRDGKTETIRAGNGEDTGMKWLLEKKHCLVIKTGEGFCRE